MEWWGPGHSFEQHETGDELTFITVRTPRKAEAAFAIILALGALVLLGLQQVAFSLLLGFAAATATFGFFSRRSRRLSVTDCKLRGDSVSVEWCEVFELRYENGDEDRPSGLAARTSRWSSRCLLQGATSEECRLIIAAIYRKWPALPMAKRPAGIWESIVGSLGKETSA